MNFPPFFHICVCTWARMPQSAYGSKRRTCRHGETHLSIIPALGKLANTDFELEVSLG